MDHSLQKAAQRKAGIAARRALSAAARSAADAALCRRIAALNCFQNARTLLAYAAFGGEADLSALLAEAVQQGCEIMGGSPSEVVVCGGGRHNPTLMAAFTERLSAPVTTAEEHGWRGDSIEAEAFAYLAARTLRGLPISFPKTTGVPAPMTGGRVARPTA